MSSDLAGLGRRVLVAALVLAAGLTCGGGELPAAGPPHIVILLADDLGWGDVGFHGSEIATPELDRLAAEGVRLDRFYVQQTCTPTRAALLTGRYPVRYGLQSAVLRPWERHGLPTHERTLAQALQQSGYRTALIGKWHLGWARSELLPTARGFDQQYGSYLGSIDYFTHRYPLGGLDWHRNDRVDREQGYSTRLLAREAVRVIDEHDPAQPLFLYLAFNAPHAPLQAPAETIARYARLPKPERRTYAAMVSELDTAVGDVVRALDRRGMRANSFVFFASDNGAAPGDGGSNGTLRGDKASLYEGALRVPAFAHWPGRLPGGARVQAPLHVVDLYPTLLGLAGAVPLGLRRLDGVDAWPTLAGGAAPAREELALAVEFNRGALLFGRWKLVLNGERPDEGRGYAAPDQRQLELFDLVADPDETRNLAGANPEVTADLLERLERHARLAAPAEGTYLRQPAPGFRPPEVWGEGEHPAGAVE